MAIYNGIGNSRHRLLSPTDIGRLKGVSRETVRSALIVGDLPFIQLRNGHRVVREEDAEKWNPRATDRRPRDLGTLTREELLLRLLAADDRVKALTAAIRAAIGKHRRACGCALCGALGLPLAAAACG